MSKRIFLFLVTCASLAGYSLPALAETAAPAKAGQRGISVNVKASEAKDAPITGTVELYNNSYALVIGIDEYSNGWPKLTNAIRDAEMIAEELEVKGFEVDLHKNLNSDELNQVFKRFFILKGDHPNARLFIWFAGHGATVDGEGYLIPADAPVPNEGAEFKLASVALRDFGTFMRQAVSKHVYAVFDSCFAGTVFSAQRALPPAAITTATTLPVRQFLTSGDADQTVSDDGAFRELFLRAIRGEERSDANGDGYLTASELGMFLGDRVTNLTESMQTPRYGKLRDKNFDRGDFVFVLPEGAVATQPGAGVQESTEIAFWNSIKNSQNPDEYEAYLAQYPAGSFAALAMVKKDNLLKPKPKPKAKPKPKPRDEKFTLKPLDAPMQAAKTANVRQRPFPSAPRVARLSAGDPVWVIGQTQTPGGIWYRVARDGTELGFVYAPLLASTTPDHTMVAFNTFTVGPQGAANTATDATLVTAEATPEPVQAEDEMEQRLNLLLEDLLDVPADTLPAETRATVAASTDLAQGGEANAAESSGSRATAFAAAALSSATASIEQATGAGGAVAASQDTVDHAADADALRAGATEEAAATVAVTTAAATTVAATTAAASTAAATTAAATTAAASTAAATTAAATTATTEKVAGSEAAAGNPAAAITGDPLVTVSAAKAEATATQTVGSAAANDATDRHTQGATLTLAAVTGQRGLPANSADTMSDLPNSKSQIKQSLVSVSSTNVEEEPPLQLASVKPMDAQAAEQVQGYSDYVRRYVTAAHAGNAKAQLSLGYMYETGDHVPQNHAEAVRWYQRAAESGEVQAMLLLGTMLETGKGVEKDLKTAAYWFQLAADAGDADAQQALAYMYEQGTGVSQDPKLAARWYEAAARQGKVVAQNNLGRLYQIGSGVSRDMDRAIYWYEQAAKQGSKAAQRNLNELLP